MLQRLLEEQRDLLDHFFKNIDLSSAETLLDLLVTCQGVVFFTGVGKSELIAKKIAMTMTSTGTKALFLSPINALHGDIGIVSKEDVFIFFSKSGETDELMNLIPYLRNKGVTLVAVVSNAKSRLAKASEITIVLPIEKELCPFDLAPTTSSTAQMIFGDALSIALMKKKEFQLDQYKLNHPAGRIGKRLILKVKDLMLRGEDLPFCQEDNALVDVLVVLSNKRCGCLLVVDQKMQLQGIFTDGDLRRSLQEHASDAMQMRMGDLMTKKPRTISPEELAMVAVKRMESQNSEITVLPVVDEKERVLGLIKMHDILQSGI